MRRSGHPSRPRAMTCCFFASLKTLLIPTKATALRRNQRPRASFPLAGFEVTLIGRFWVTPEEFGNALRVPEGQCREQTENGAQQYMPPSSVCSGPCFHAQQLTLEFATLPEP